MMARRGSNVVTRLNFPGVPQIIDWSHAAEHVWAVAHEVPGEPPPAAQRWAGTQLEALWEGHVAEVVQTLDRLHLDQESYSPLVQQAPDYFRTRQKQMQYDRSAPKAGPSAAAWWKAPPTPWCIIA